MQKIATEDVEKKLWNDYFSQALHGEGQEQDRSDVWWNTIDVDLKSICERLFPSNKKISLLEIGCGSGINTFVLANSLNVGRIDLVDISDKALEYAKTITPQNLKRKTNYIELSAFKVASSITEKFDLVCSTGLIEHYTPTEITDIVRNMLSVVSDDGYILLGIPNVKNIAVLKACFLGSSFARKYLKFIGGYRNTTEKMYSDTFISNLVLDNFDVNVSAVYAGSVSLVGTPKFFVSLLNKIFKRTRFSFLTYFVISKRF